MKKSLFWDKEEDKLLKENINLSIKELCLLIGRSDGAIRNRKYVLGLKSNKFPLFTDKEKEIIKEWYTKEDGVNLEELSKFLGRPKTSVSKVAKDLGLTCYGNFTIKEKEIRASKMVNKVKGSNPSRFSGHKHSDISREKVSKGLILAFSKIPNDIKKERAMKAVETKRKNGGFNTTSNAYSRCKGGYRTDLKHYFRSSWEANIARILNYYNIKWEYEIKRFDFSNEYEGVLSYQPDFYLPEYNIWIEVKGWMDEKSKERLKLFSQYYPKENKNLFLIDSNTYSYLSKNYLNIIKYWEYKGNYKKAS